MERQTNFLAQKVCLVYEYPFLWVITATPLCQQNETLRLLLAVYHPQLIKVASLGFISENQ